MMRNRKPSRLRSPSTGRTCAPKDLRPTLLSVVSIGFHGRIAKGVTDGSSRISPDAIRIVSEGDSWFQYPWILDDVVDQLLNRYAIFSLGAAGDLLSEMIHQDELLDAVADQSPQLVLLSGGGNDLLGNHRLAKLLHPYEDQRTAKDYPNEKFNDLLVRIGEHYRQIIRRLTKEFPKIRVLCHSYDWAIPQKRGRWLGRAMESIKITDQRLQEEIVRVLIDQFDCTLLGVVREFEGVLHRVDCRAQ